MFYLAKRLAKYLRKYWAPILLSIASSLLVVGIIALIPDYVKYLVNALQKKDIARLNLLIAAGVGIVLIKDVMFYGQIYFSSLAAQKVVYELREEIFQHYLDMPFVFYVKWRTGELISRLTTDITLIEETLVNNLVKGFPQILLLLALLFRIFYLNWKLASLSLVCVPLIGYTISYFGEIIHRLTGKKLGKMADISSVAEEVVSGIRVVKAFVREDYERDHFARENHRHFEINMRRARIEAMQEPVIELLAIVGVMLVIWLAAQDYISGRMAVSEMMAFFTAIALLVDPVRNISQVYSTWAQSAASARRIFEILDIENEITDNENAQELEKVRGAIDFNNVSFAYTEETLALRNINLKVKPGEIIALVGPSGAGKTTLLNLIPRFYDPTQGEILLDGKRLRSVTLHSLRESIGFVPQETVLFSGSVRDNIRYGRLDASDDEIEAAAKAANAHRFIVNLTNGYDTEVGEKGVKLSGGEKQRLAISRVFLRNPRIILLDEATSALDSESEQLVKEAIEKLMAGRTTFVIAHRFSTIQHADRIVVLENGRLIEQGHHQTLVNAGGLYQRLSDLQVSGQR